MARTRNGSVSPLPLPEGYAWRRAALQLTERFGAMPGDRIAIIAPATNDPTAGLVKRLPRMQWVQIAGGPFGWDTEKPAGIQRIIASPDQAPFASESLDGIVSVLTVPLLSEDEHERFVSSWAKTLAPLGKWLGLLALESSLDTRLAEAEDLFKTNDFTRVRANRLAGGGGSATLVIISAKRE